MDEATTRARSFYPRPTPPPEPPGTYDDTPGLVHPPFTGPDASTTDQSSNRQAASLYGDRIAAPSNQPTLPPPRDRTPTTPYHPISSLDLRSAGEYSTEQPIQELDILESLELPPLEPEPEPVPWSPRFSSFPDWETLERFRLMEYPDFGPPVFKFSPDMEAAEYNWKLLESHDFDLDSILRRDPHCQLYPGSEFRNPDELDVLFGGYIDWWFIRTYLTNGAESFAIPLPEEIRQEALLTCLEYGNHTPEDDELMKLLLPEIEKGFFMPIPLSELPRLPNVVVAPLNIDWHFSIDDEGNRVHKPRLIHDMTYTPHLDIRLGDWDTADEIDHEIAATLREQIRKKGQSISLNTRNISSILPPCRYGHALSRFLAAVHELRRRYPEEPIFISKTDWKAAYRRIHAQASLAYQTIVVIGPLAYICLRFTFGQASAPPLFSAASDMLACFITYLIFQPYWGPEGRLGSYDHHIDWSMPASSEEPLGQAYPMSVVPTLHGNFTNDIYIDDNIAATIRQNAKRVVRAMMYALEVMDCPRKHSVLKRDPLLSLSKLGVEGSPTEIQEVLGWEIDTRRFVVGLSPGKFLNWSTDLDEILQPQRGATQAELHSLLGRLENLCTIFRPGKHFLGNLRFALNHAVAKNRRKTHLTNSQRLDGLLFRKFLEKCRHGISINLCVPRRPDRVTRVDACMYGMGGYSLSSGIAWQILLPPELQFRIHINLLEFLAEFVSVLMDHHFSHTEWPPYTCLLTLGDNMNAIRWMARTRFHDGTRPGHNLLARTFAQWWLDHDCVGYGQWLPGTTNGVADTLSRYFQYPHSQLSQVLHEVFPLELPHGFRIEPVPEEILRTVLGILRKLPLNPESQDPNETRPTWLGADGKISSVEQDTTDLVRFLTAQNTTNETRSSVISQPDFASANSPANAVIDWAVGVSQPPVELWQRRF